MATGGNESASDEIINIKCSICAEKNITREAEKHCVECQAYYCIPCSDMHKMFPLMRGHKLLDKASFDTSQLQSTLPCFPTEVCSVHKARLLEMYCRNHDEIVCATCVALNHRTCKHIHSIPDEVDALYQNSESEEIKSKLTAAKKTMGDIKKAKEDLVIELKKYKKKATASIGKFRKEMEAVLERLENESIKEVEAEYGRTEAKLQKEIKEVENVTADLEQYANKLKMSAGNKAQEFVCVKASQKSIKKVKEAESRLKKPEGVELNFLIDTQIQTFLQQLKTLGQITMKEPAPKATGSTAVAIGMYTPKSTVYAVKKQKEVSVKQGNDANSYTFGSCFTEDGSLLLADHNNRKLKLVDFSADCIKDHLDLETHPIAVCLTGKHEAAVSLVNNTIQFVSLGNKLSAGKQLKLDHRCYDLAYKDNKLFISDQSKAVYIHDVTGSLLHTVTTDSLGKPIFSASGHISLSSNRDKVYVTDKNKGLVTLDMQGHYESTLTDPDVAKPQGLCGDGKGNIFISGYGSSTIVQIGEKSRTKLGVLGKVEDSLSACFDPQQNRLVVTSAGKNPVTVYELE